MLLSHDMLGVSWFCFRCKDKGREPHGVQSLEELKRRTLEYKTRVQGMHGLDIPEDYTLDVPAHAAVWYLSKGISYELAKQHGIGWSPSLDRIVIPVYEDVWREDISGEQLVNVQLRAWQDGVKPKYITPGAYKYPAAMFWNDPHDQPYVVITEDVLSSIKVGREYNAAATLGTNLSSSRAWKISKKYRTALVWYDDDKAGRSAAKEAERQLTLMGVRFIDICTPLDPKKYTRDEIRLFIQTALKEIPNG